MRRHDRLRTHVDIDTQAGLRHLEGVVATRETLHDLHDIQIVAFPQSGLLQRPGTADLLDRAMVEGADVLGGLDPALIDGDPVRRSTRSSSSPNAMLPIDIHLHEPGAMGVLAGLILDRIAALGMQGRSRSVTASVLATCPSASATRCSPRMAARRCAPDDCAAFGTRAAAHGLPRRP